MYSTNKVHILIDNGSTYNFVQQEVVEKIKLPITTTKQFKVDARADAQLFIRTGRSDDGMDQAGSGVVDECTCSSGVESSFICRSSGINETDGLSLVSIVIQAVYSADAGVFEELRAVVVFD
ncbi:hypothetical protein Tco_1554323 [Tanacetum coccineum]